MSAVQGRHGYAVTAVVACFILRVAETTKASLRVDR